MGGHLIHDHDVQRCLFIFGVFCIELWVACRSVYSAVLERVLDIAIYVIFFFLFKQKTASGMRISDWSSDVCSSDLRAAQPACRRQNPPVGLLAQYRSGRSPALWPHGHGRRHRGGWYPLRLSFRCWALWPVPAPLCRAARRAPQRGQGGGRALACYRWLHRIGADAKRRAHRGRSVSGLLGLSRAVDRGRAQGRRSEEHTSELQSLMRISYAVFRFKKKNKY